MADIFISYSGEDKSYVKGFAEMLQGQGWTVWWDRQIPIGRQFDSVIEEELALADCVIVFWTRRSVASEWVRSEANEAARQGKLVPVLWEDVELPLAFKRTEAAQLSNWDGNPDHPELPLLFDSISQTIQHSKKKKELVGETPVSGEKEKTRQWNFDSLKTGKTAARTYITVAVIGFLVSLLTVFYYLRFIQGNVSSQVDQRMFYLILVLFGIAASAVIFGIMNSYAAMKGEMTGARLKYAGPVAGVVLTVLGGFYLPHGSVEKNVIIRVFDQKKNPVNGGEVKMFLHEYVREQSIDRQGQALFAGVPGEKLREKIKLEVSSPGFTTRVFDTVLNQSASLELTLPLTTSVMISGTVKTAAEMPIREVEINVDGTRYFTHSITNGTYSLRLKEYTLGDEITITTSHQGYEDKTRALKITSQDMKEIDFVLQPVNQ